MKLYMGIDAVDIDRIKKSMKKQGFLKKVLGENEYAYYEKKGFSPESIAAAFCAKEAFSKAMGTGIRGFSMSEVEVIHDILGKPYYRFSGKAKDLVDSKHLQFSLSITHTDTTAFAVATAVKKKHILWFYF